MKIKNIEGLSATDLQEEEQKGAKFIYYSYTISLILLTFRRTSGVYMIRPGESSVTKGLPFTIISFLFGWWGIPFGPKYTVESLRTNLHGGKDVTDEVMSTVAGHVLYLETQKQKAIRNKHSF